MPPSSGTGVPGTPGFDPTNWENFPAPGVPSTTSGGYRNPWEGLPDGNVYAGQSPDPTDEGWDNGSMGSPNGRAQRTTQKWLDPEEIFKEWMKRAGTDPVGFRRGLYELWAAGFLDSEKFSKVKGGWTEKASKALYGALEKYLEISQTGGVPKSFSEFLRDQALSNGLPGTLKDFTEAGGDDAFGSDGAKLPPPVRLTDPEAIRQVALRAAQTALGRDFTEDEKNRFVEAIHNSERSEQNAVTGETTSLDITSQAYAFAEETAPTEFQSHKAQGYVNALMADLLGKGGVPQFEVNPGR